MNEDELYEMDDDALEEAYRAAKAEEGTAEEEDVVIEEEQVDETEVEDIEEETESEDEVETKEEEEVEDLEQPENQDSDDDTSEEDEVEEESEEDSESEEDPDGETAEEEEQTDEDETEAKAEPQPIQRHKFKANGREYEFTDGEIQEQFPKIFGQAMDYTKKMQQIKPWRKTIDAIEQANLDHDQVNLMIDVLKGDKGAINEVLKRTKVDTLELEDSEAWTPKDYGRDEKTLDLNDVIREIEQDSEYETTKKILGSDWDDRSWNDISKDPELVRLLHVDVKSGMYDKVQPIAEKLKVYGRGVKSDLDYYKEAANVYFEQQNQENVRLAEADRVKAETENKRAEKAQIAEVKAKQKKAKAVKQGSAKRKAAAPTKKSAGTSKGKNYLDDSDEAFEDWYKALEERM